MKKLLATGLLSLGLVGCATTPQQPSEPVKFEKVYQIDGLKQGQIYDGARQWFATAFRSANAVIQYEDKTTGSIIGKGNMPYRCSGFADCMTVTAGDRVDFTVRVDTKDGKMKVSYDNLTHYKPVQVISGVRYSETNRTITENYPSAKIIMDELNKSSDQMAEKIKTQQKVNADW
ncbi:DUF4468 domain-containing protein [Acinetobacter seifertii]|uniref:DUF4468 domain-containing protein n=1 Tax=Acinetobacter seifertii TaxID=1530123 RepID=UPI001C0C0BCD|nr:DUF4468 domain-containing protein [Acinetobacter seifertii]MBU3085758.1 DUF4468 domain-containing protein [Acinetobacter seifertii]